MWHTPRFPGRILFSPRNRGPTGSRRSSHWRASRPRLEALEGRALLSTVTSLLDNGAPETLRYQIENDVAGETITFDPTLFRSGPRTITLSQAPGAGQLQVNKGLTILGPGANKLTVSGNNASVVFKIDASVPVTISGLTISHGRGGNEGGGIDNAGTLTLNSSTVSDNWAGQGGGLYNSGTATITACTFISNYGSWSGSALYNVGIGTLTMDNSTVSGNAGFVPDPDDWGGFGCIGAESPSLTIITNCTISGNTGGFGGIWNDWWSGYGDLRVRNTIIAGNTGDVHGDIVSLGHNLIGNTSGGSGFRTDLGDLLDVVDPLLGPLQDNGGPTFTLALKPGSPAIDKGDNTDAPPFDQRGEGYPRIVNGTIDIGAYELQTASTASTTTILTSSFNHSDYGQSVTFTAAVSSDVGTPTGTVTFKEGTIVLDTGTLDASGRATFTTSSLGAGTHSIAAVYSGDTNFSASATALSQVVNWVSTTTTLSSSANPSIVGQAVTFTAKVTAVNPDAGTLTGRVGFREGSTTLGVAWVDTNGQATLTFPGKDGYGTDLAALSPGSHKITAYYWYDPIFGESTSTALTQMVNQTSASTTTTLTSSPTSSVSGQWVTFTATVTSSGTGFPTGTVTFKDGSTSLGTGTLDSTGKATFPTAALSVGTHSITAVYSSSKPNNFSDSSTTMALTQTVNKANTTTSLTSSANPSVRRQAVTFTATVAVVSPGAGTPAGTVTFYDGSTALGTRTLNASGIATFTTSSLRVGTHTITTAYTGNTNYKPSTSTKLFQTVNA